MEGGQEGSEKKVLPPFIKLKQGPYFFPFAPLFCFPTDKKQRAGVQRERRTAPAGGPMKIPRLRRLKKKGQRHHE